jgi:quercetin dioxygenase-like cupin family protein
MRASIAASAFLSFVALIGGPAEAAQELDSPKADPTHHKVEFENEYVRVVRWGIPPHEKTALHDHPSLVNILLTDADLKLTTPDGRSSEIHGKAGAAAWRGPTVHTAENIGDRPVEGILVEPKGAGNAAWKPPTRDAVKVTPHDKLEFENDQVRIVRYAYAKGESSPMHEHPSGVQILLTDVHGRQTTPDGKAVEISGKAGSVRYRPPLAHAIENTGERFEGILVDLKGAPSEAAER